MLPAFSKTIARPATALILSLALALPAAPALALDRHEQGIVAGALGLLLVQGLIQASKAPQYAAPAPAPLPTPLPVQPVYAAPVVPAYTTPAAYAFNSYSSGERRAIQRSLARSGYYFGPIDGAFGRGTYNATAAFARDTGSATAINTQAGAYGVYDRLLYAAN